VLEFDGGVDFAGLRAKPARVEAGERAVCDQAGTARWNFQRRVLGISHGLDADLFADFAWGTYGARQGGALKLWDRTAALHDQGLANQTWMEIAVTSGTTSFTYEDGASQLEQAAGFHGPHHYFAEVASDPEVLKFVDQHLPQLESASVISMSGNGDPQGIWLFSGNRNLDPAKHWAFDPARIGQDPEGVMPRITAERFRALRLHGPVGGTPLPTLLYVGDIVPRSGRQRARRCTNEARGEHAWRCWTPGRRRSSPSGRTTGSRRRSSELRPGASLESSSPRTTMCCWRAGRCGWGRMATEAGCDRLGAGDAGGGANRIIRDGACGRSRRPEPDGVRFDRRN
jgi:hypothetical protein